MYYPRSRVINIHNLTRHPPHRTRNPRFPPRSPVRQPLRNIKNKKNHKDHFQNPRDLPRHHRGLLDDHLAYVGFAIAHTYAVFAAEGHIYSRRAFCDITGRYTTPGHVVVAVYSNGVASTCTRSTLRRSILRLTSTPP